MRVLATRNTAQTETPALDFQDIEITPEMIVEAARSFLGCEYSATRTFIRPDGTGQADCAGVFLLVAQRVGLLLPSFDINTPWRVWGKSRSEILSEILRLNFVAVAPDDAQPADVLLIREDAGEPRHIAIVTTCAPLSILQALNDETGGGRVGEAHVTAHEWARVKAAYRLRVLA